jgi:hypothetical protein
MPPVRLTTTQTSAPAKARSAPAQATIASGERLRLRETGERGLFTFERGDERLGEVRQWRRGKLRLTLGSETFDLEPNGRGFGLLLLTEDEQERARFVDRRLRGDHILTGERELSFTDDDEHLEAADGTRLASFTPKRGSGRVVVIAVHDEDDPVVVAFAATIVLLRRLPARPPKRTGLDSAEAWENRGHWVAGAMTGHADGGF